MYDITCHIFYPESQFPAEMEPKDVQLFLDSFELSMLLMFPWIHSVSLSLTDAGRIPWFDQYPAGTTFTFTKTTKVKP